MNFYVITIKFNTFNVHLCTSTLKKQHKNLQEVHKSYIFINPKMRCSSFP